MNINGTRFKDFTGMKNNRLTAIKPYKQDKYGRMKWIFQCDCGNRVIITPDCVFKKNPTTKSCGCLNDEVRASGANRRTHGMVDTRLYKIWTAMKRRCNNTHTTDYKQWYGKRGIKVCDDWENNFLSFYKWAMGNGYSDELSIDRIDPNKGYCPDNCRWATFEEQANNKRNNRYLTYNGVTHTMREWSNILGVKYHILNSRINSYNWTVEEAIETPVGKRRKTSNSQTPTAL